MKCEISIIKKIDDLWAKAIERYLVARDRKNDLNYGGDKKSRTKRVHLFGEEMHNGNFGKICKNPCP